MIEKRVCLDKSINLTRAIMNEEVAVPENIIVHKLFGGMHSFKFNTSDVELPIQHIGLAVLANEAANNQYTFTKIGPNGEEVKLFEPVFHEYGYSISDFLKTFTPDALNWYKRENGQEYTMEYVNGKVLREPANGHLQCKALDADGEIDYRELAVREAFKDSITNYLKQDVSSQDEDGDLVLSTGELASDFYFAESDIFENNLQLLKTAAQQNIPQAPQVSDVTE